MKKRICCVTSTRAEYGLMSEFMKSIHESSDLSFQLVVTGTHLSAKHGMTIQEIESDGLPITEKVLMPINGDGPAETAKSMAAVLTGMTEVFMRLSPHIVILNGDRFETLAAAQAAMLCRIPIGHISGGELTEGAMDDAIRHSITKLSHLHFVAADEYMNRVVQLGENPETVFNVGDLGVENIRRTTLWSREQLEKDLEFTFTSPTFLVTYHPTTLETSNPADSMGELLKALEQFPRAKILFTLPNADPGNEVITDLIHDFVRRNSSRAMAKPSLGKVRYLTAMKYADVVLGNSSSGIVEAPVFKKPTVDVGSRQTGRLMATSIIRVEEECSAIAEGLTKALSAGFQDSLSETKSLYGDGKTSEAIINILRKKVHGASVKKKFFDL